MKNQSLLVLLLFAFKAMAQTPIDVAESTLKVGAFAEEEFYYGFAEGDQMVFNFEEVNGRELKELEIIELPSSSKFMDYKTKKIQNKTLSITQTGIYKFRFSNSAISGRICKFKIQRIPAGDAVKNFNTSVYWKTVIDTTYKLAQEKFLVSSDTTALSVLDQKAKVSSQHSLNGTANKTIVDFELPKGTIKWSYYIGVGNEGKKSYDDATDNFLSSSASAVASIPGYGLMASLALNGLNSFNKAQGGDNVKYWFITDWNNVLSWQSNGNFLQYKQGNVVNDASQMKFPLEGKVFIGLMNDNIMEPIEVYVKVTAIQVNQKWEERTIQKMKIDSRKEAYLNN